MTRHECHTTQRTNQRKTTNHNKQHTHKPNAAQDDERHRTTHKATKQFMISSCRSSLVFSASITLVKICKNSANNTQRAQREHTEDTKESTQRIHSKTAKQYDSKTVRQQHSNTAGGQQGSKIARQ